MKTNLSFITCALSLLFIFSACTPKEADLDTKLNFSKLSHEEQKQTIEDNGMQLLDAVTGLEDTKAVEASTSFVLRVNKNSPMTAPLMQFRNDLVMKSKKLTTNFNKALKVMVADSLDIPWGEWEFNFTTQEMDKVKDMVNTIVVRFPADSVTKTNNGLITFTYKESDVVIPETGDLFPSEITFSMKVDNVEAMSAIFTGTYFDDATPKNVKEELKIEDYSWNTTITNNQKVASASYEIKKGKMILMKTAGELAGDLTRKSIEVSDPINMNVDFLESLSLHYQVMDMAIVGGTKDFQPLITELKALSKTANSNSKADLELVAALINKYMVCYAYFVQENKKFADVEIYLEEYINEYQMPVFDPATGFFVIDPKTQMPVFTTIKEVSYELQPRLIMSDGSKVSVEDYFTDGFEEMINTYMTKASKYEL
jgi:hypothetical protein